ncbi:serine/threonine protein kinase [Stackebrandtia nassauensis DSM 44728]|uniref:non-specific serine/threonine protein kinase n=2 Tax=Stackebrandtia TaxID=283810 RepID=D3Q5J0_STANL|nr:serine/threonine protein kinase [Stackebrandtia nassauensis DSM 44728]
MVGDLLAERYSLTAHVNDDSSGRQVWRGMDVLLNRSVTVVLRTPGGAEAEEMLNAAVAASRVNHPNIVGVYDAVDQGDCAYIVREWVEGQALRDVIAASAIPVEDAAGIIQCVASAVAAVHATGVAHGNVHPGTILLSDDDRVVLADPRADAGATQVGDVRALGATLYCAITGGWPRTVPGPASLPDAPTDSEGMPMEPKELRDDVPDRVNRLVCSLLEPSQAPPTAAELADELDHLSFGPDTGTLAIVQTGEIAAVERERVLPPHVVKKRLLFGGAALAGLALLGLIIALIVIPSGDTPGDQANAGDSSEEGKDEDIGAPEEVKLKEGDLKVLDPSGGDTSAPNETGLLVDGDSAKPWKTNEYNQQNWGNFMEGMGIMLDLGEERRVQQVVLDLPQAGNEIAIYAGKGSLETGKEIKVDDLDVISGKQTNETASSLKFPAAAEAPKTQYLLIWCTKPGPVNSKFQLQINEIEVHAQ